MADYKQIYEECRNNLINKNAVGLNTFEKAFLYAEKLHANQFRKSGEPYILHPVEVMSILEKLDFDTDVLASALLHDVIEDCDISKQQLAKLFNNNIAEIVDAVSEFSGGNEEKWQTELKTYQKLVSIGKHNLFGFYIKFADRLNNMSTLSVFPHYKQLDKVKQTEKYVLPIAKLLKSHYFDSKLSSLCYYYSLNNQTRQNMLEMYQRSLNSTKSIIEALKTNLRQELLSCLNNKGKLKDIIISNIEMIEIKNNIFDYYSFKDESEINISCFTQTPLYEANIIIDDCIDLNKFFFSFIEQSTVKNLFTLCDFVTDEYGQYFIIQTPQRLKVKVFVCNSESYILRRNGSLQGIFSSLLEEDFEQKIETDYICVYTPKKEKVYMPKDSTVLDFAFKIHKDFGFCVMHAYLNDSPAKSPVWTHLSPNDIIKLEIARDENGHLLNIAKIRWLAYANCELSRKTLIKYFEKLYE